MKKWTKAERERASREGKARWAARKLRSNVTDFSVAGGAGGPGRLGQSDVVTWPIGGMRVEAGSGGGSANAAGGWSGASSDGGSDPVVRLGYTLATDIVRLIAHDVPADVIVKVVERILRP